MMLLSTDSLISNPQGWADNFCNDCILFLRDLASIFGVSYAELNIFLFCFLMPFLILYFMTLALLNCRWRTKTLRWVTVISAIITILLPVIILFVAIVFFKIEQVPLQPPH